MDDKEVLWRDVTPRRGCWEKVKKPHCKRMQSIPIVAEYSHPLVILWELMKLFSVRA